MQVGSQISGIILALFADFNTKVVKSRFIARLDPLPFQAKADQEQKAEAAAKPAHVNRPDEWHIVKPGETLSGIAQDYLGDAGKSTELAKINGISDPNMIRVGQKIQIPR